MKRIIESSPEFHSAVLEIRRSVFRPRLKLVPIIFLALFLSGLTYESPTLALGLSSLWTWLIFPFFFIGYYPKALWFTKDVLTKKVFKGSRALVSCSVCAAKTHKLQWYPEQNVLTKFKMTKNTPPSYEKRTSFYIERVDHYSSDGSSNGYSELPKKYKHYAATWTEDWELEYKCPKCGEVSALKVTDYLDDGWCTDFEIITKPKKK